MCINGRRPQRDQAGLTLIELVMFIVIVSVALAGVLLVLTQTARSSADPQLRKQALSIAEALLEEIELAHFTYCDPNDANAATAANAAGCFAPATTESVGPEALNTARPYDNVNDYVTAYGTPKAYSQDANGTSIAITGNYTAKVTITQDGGLGPSGSQPANTEVLRISVTVSYGTGNDSVTLDGYRTRYAPNALP